MPIGLHARFLFGDWTMDETKYKVLANGAVYDLEQKRIVRGAALDSATASALASRKAEKRREIARAAANAAVERADYHASYGDLAFVAAIIQTAMMKAQTPDDPKAIEAARFVMLETGESEKLQSDAAVPVSEMRGLLRDIAEVARSIAAAQQPAD